MVLKVIALNIARENSMAISRYGLLADAELFSPGSAKMDGQKGYNGFGGFHK